MRYVEAAQVAGPVRHATIFAATSSRTPSAPVLAQLSVNIGWAILLTAALSLHRRRRASTDPRMGQHDRHGLPERRHRPVVAVDLPGPGAGDHRFRLLARRLRRSKCWPIRRAAARLPWPRLRPRRRRRTQCRARSAADAGPRAISAAGCCSSPRSSLGILLVSFLLVKTDSGRSGGPDAGSHRHRRRPSPRCGRIWASTSRSRAVLASISGTCCTAISARPGRRRSRCSTDLLQRFPATLELVTLSLLVAIAHRRAARRRLRPSSRTASSPRSPTSTG